MLPLRLLANASKVKLNFPLNFQLQIQNRYHGVSTPQPRHLRCSPQAARTSLHHHKHHANDARSKEKTHINVVVIGHVDSGKSTTTGRKQPHPNERIAQ
jgi:polynucleotide 5'-kinase involved in rRNA processing